MKKLETLLKEANTMTTADFEAIVNCPEVACESLTATEKLAIVVFNEYSKAINNKTVTCVLDCNYSNSKLHTRVDKDGKPDPEYLVDYFRLIDDHNDCLARCYIHISIKKDKKTGKESATVTTDIRFSCKKAVLACAENLEKYADFLIFRYKATQKVRNVQKPAVPYTEFVKTAKLALALLTDSRNAELVKSLINTETEPETEEE